MKNQDSGIEKEVDMLGRVVLPKDFRRRLGLEKNSRVRITMEGETVNIRPIRSVCLMCKKREDPDPELMLCESCIAKVLEHKNTK